MILIIDLYLEVLPGKSFGKILKGCHCIIRRRVNLRFYFQKYSYMFLEKASLTLLWSAGVYSFL